MMLWVIAALILVAVITIAGCQIAVNHAAKGRLYSVVSETPHREVALLLGTNPLGRTGRPNQFFLRRIEATAALYEAGKFDRLIISGAKRGEDYDEPAAMKAELLRRGVPGSIIVLDGEGHRTINSVERAKEVFGVDTLTFISQQFHNERTLFLAKHMCVDAIAFNAANTQSRRWKYQMRLRECFARVKAVWEMIEYKNQK